MGSDLGILAAPDPGPVVHVLLGAAIAAVHGAMIDGQLSRGIHDLVVASRRRRPATAHAALNQAL
jgi:hypothetical protein